MRCYRHFKEVKEEPWLKDLIRQEKSRRMRIYRLKTAGITPEVLSYEEYMKPHINDDSEDDAFDTQDETEDDGDNGDDDTG